jgi:hypothetical protein
MGFLEVDLPVDDLDECRGTGVQILEVRAGSAILDLRSGIHGR